MIVSSNPAEVGKIENLSPVKSSTHDVVNAFCAFNPFDDVAANKASGKSSYNNLGS
jgi:hypothetical protein